MFPGPSWRAATISKRLKQKRQLLEQANEPNLPRNDVSITFKNRTQREYAKLIQDNSLVFSIGPAGTGKTFIPSVLAAQRLNRGDIDRIVVCRPAIPAGGENIGFLPGEINDKMMPYLRPVFDAFKLFWPQSRIKTFLEYGQLEIVPLAFMRGRTFINSMIIADECQNSTVDQLLMLVTRLGDNSNMVVTGDPMQSDLGSGKPCFDFARRRLSGIPGIAFIDFAESDVVRHPLVQKILYAWADDEEVEDEEFAELPEFVRPAYMNGHAEVTEPDLGFRPE